MSSSEPIALPKRIIEEATRLFVIHGYHRLSMREIAESVGISKAGLYYHFKDKEDLFLAILVANLDSLETLIRDARQQGRTTRERIEHMMRALLAQTSEHRAIIRLASQEMAHLSQATRVEFRRLYQAKFIAQVEAILRDGMVHGEIRAMDVHLATWILLGMVYPFFYPAHEKELGPPEEAIELVVTLFFEGAQCRVNPTARL